MQYCSLQHWTTSITSHIHNWASFLLWLHLFFLSGVIYPLFSNSILGTHWAEEFIFQCHIFLPFHTVHGLPWRLRRWSVCPQCGRPRFNPQVGKIPWRRKWQPTPVLLPRKLLEWRSLVGYSPWGCKESDTTEWLHFYFHCSWGSQGKNTEVICHSLLQWTSFCQNSPPWPVHHGWPYTAWLIVSLS